MLRHGSLECHGRPDSRLVVAAVNQALDEPGAIVLHGFAGPEPHDDLARLGRAIGTLSAADIATPDGDWIHRVEARETPLQDSVGNPILSTTHGHFACHTDEFFSPHPADVVMQFCVQAAQDGGGRSVVAFVRDIVARLDEGQIDVLSAATFPVRFGHTALLAAHDGGWHLRYNRDELPRRSLTPAQCAALDALEDAIDRCAYDFALAPGDCLVLDNRTALHGRTRFGLHSGRVLLRMRVYRTSVEAERQGARTA